MAARAKKQPWPRCGARLHEQPPESPEDAVEVLALLPAEDWPEEIEPPAALDDPPLALLGAELLTLPPEDTAPALLLVLVERPPVEAPPWLAVPPLPPVLLLLVVRVPVLPPVPPVPMAPPSVPPAPPPAPPSEPPEGSGIRGPLNFHQLNLKRSPLPPTNFMKRSCLPAPPVTSQVLVVHDVAPETSQVPSKVPVWLSR
jgi:hypothetical protein